MRPIAAVLAVAVISLCAGSAVAQEVASVSSASIISNIKAQARDGQVFITWDEAAAPEGAHLKAYLSHELITVAGVRIEDEAGTRIVVRRG